MTIRCKFYCATISETLHNLNGGKKSLYEAKFNVVYDGSEENKQFFQWTPTGELRVGLYKENTFQVGKEYYIDITAV